MQHCMLRPRIAVGWARTVEPAARQPASRPGGKAHLEKGEPLTTVDYQDLRIDGVRVETFGTPSGAPPLLFVHGGCQGSWAWEKMAPRLARGLVCGVPELVWHHGSTALPHRDAVTRSLLDVTTEVGLVTAAFVTGEFLQIDGDQSAGR